MQSHPHFSAIDKSLVERIIDEACVVLEKTGVIVEDEVARNTLSEAGLRINPSSRKTYFSRACVEKCLETAPSTIELYDRDGNPAAQLAGQRLHFTPGSAALEILDVNARTPRKPATRDLVQFARLTQHLEHLAIQSTALVPADVPEKIADRYRLYIALQVCELPIVSGTFTPEGFKSMKNMLVVIRGGNENLRRKPLAIFDCCPTSPLKWSAHGCHDLIQCARSGIPAELVSMPLAGATAPVTLPGILVQHTSENLSGLVIHQLTSPGSPVIWGGSPTIFDMRFGTTPMGSIEAMMLASGTAAIGKHLGLPTHGYLCLSDSKHVDVQAGFESGMGALFAALSGLNVIAGPGMLSFQTCQSLEKLVIDNEICGACLRLQRGIEMHEPSIANDLMGDIHHAEHFLTSPNTLRWMRDEFFTPSDIIDRYPSFAPDQKSILERAHAKGQSILSNEPVPALENELRDELERMMLADAKKAGMVKLPDLRIDEQ
ncbi:trimethylamine methyltransferase family protein [candidate division KSB1 bacterium]|nr:trimethylamine methyltransferase family protein [candidate division KSB1 bacterium]